MHLHATCLPRGGGSGSGTSTPRPFFSLLVLCSFGSCLQTVPELVPRALTFACAFLSPRSATPQSAGAVAP